MKTAIVFSDGIKQIIFTPENEDEKLALKLITVNDDISLAVKQGSFGQQQYEPYRHNVQMCQGDYLRVFSEQNSVMLVLTPKKEK